MSGTAGRAIIVNLTLDQLEDKQTMLVSNLNISELTAQTQSHGNLISEKERGPGPLKAALGDVMAKALRQDPVTAAFGSFKGGHGC